MPLGHQALPGALTVLGFASRVADAIRLAPGECAALRLGLAFGLRAARGTHLLRAAGVPFLLGALRFDPAGLLARGIAAITGLRVGALPQFPGMRLSRGLLACLRLALRVLAIARLLGAPLLLRALGPLALLCLPGLLPVPRTRRVILPATRTLLCLRSLGARRGLSGLGAIVALVLAALLSLDAIAMGAS
ncbi:hypothetical protein [Luteimonas pelagia]